MPKTLQESQK